MMTVFLAAAAEALPELRPPVDVIPAGRWEGYVGWLGLMGTLFMAVDVLALVWWMRRGGSDATQQPAVIAQMELRTLTRGEETAETATRVSAAVRQYIASAVAGDARAMTSLEVSKAVAADGRFEPVHVSELSGLLSDCDQRQFAVAAPKSAGLAPRAITLLEKFEARLKPPPETE